MSTPLRAAALSLLALALLVLPAAAQPPALPPTTLPQVQLTGPAPLVFERLGGLYGVRVKVDSELPGRSLTLSLRNVTFEDTLRVAAALSQSIWAVQPDGVVLVTPDTSEKRERLFPQVERIFALPGRSSDEINEAVRILREMLDMRRIRPDTRSSSFSVYDTPERLAVAEQLLAQLPDDPGEVFLEVQILEIDRERALELGLLTPDSVVAVHLGAGALVPSDIDSLLEIVQFLIGRGLIPGSLIAPEVLAVLSSGLVDPSQAAALLPGFILAGGGSTTYALHLPSTELRLRQFARVLRSWQRVSLRTQAGRQGVIFIGERFPITFTTFSSIFLPQILQELIRLGQFTPAIPAMRYEDLGLKVTVTPWLHPGREVSLALAIEQSALSGQIINDVPVLRNRLLEQQVRLRIGETLMIAGLRSTDRTAQLQATPGLASLPLIGPAFRSVSPVTRTTEQLILVTPYLMRLPAAERLIARTLFLGTEKDFAPVGPQPTGEPAAAPPPPAQPPQRPQPQRPAQPPPPGAPTPLLGPPPPPQPEPPPN